MKEINEYSLILVGAIVSLISYLVGQKFILFFLGGIGLFCYGGVRLFILKNKSKEKITKDEHDTKIAMHRISYPVLPVKTCHSCSALLPERAKYCMHCGTHI